MTAPAPVPPPSSGPGPGIGRSFVAVAGLVARSGVSRTRIAGLLVFAAIGVVAAALTGEGTPNAVDLTEQIDGFVLRFLAPVTALLFATAAFGDMVDDGSLVYLWLRPVRRWVTALAGTAAPLATSLLIVLPATVAFALASGSGGTGVVAAVAASTVALVAYVPIFVGLGLRIRRSLLWGLAYILIWEAAVAPNSDSLARLSVRTYARSVLSGGLDAETCPGTWPCLDVFTVSVGTAVAAGTLIGVAGFVWTVRRLHVQDVP